MRYIFSLLVFFSSFLLSEEKAVSQPSPVVKEEFVAENQSLSLSSKKIAYTFRAGSITVQEGETSADIHFMAYLATPTHAKESRPIAFCFNGGPGSSSIWLHMSLLGPKIITERREEGSYKDNTATLLDMCDLVFIDPVGTGFFEENKEAWKKFYNVEADARSIASFIQHFLSKYQRWHSPKLLIGESYGTGRAILVTQNLQNEYSLNIDGLILISLALDFQTSDSFFSAHLPTYAAISQYHGLLKEPYSSMPAKELSEKVISFVENEYTPALFAGTRVPKERREAIALKLSQLTSLSTQSILENDLRISAEEYAKKLLKEKSLTIGSFDGRITTWAPPRGRSVCHPVFGSSPDPSFHFIAPRFACAFNDYVTRELHWYKEEPYHLLAFDANSSWNCGTMAAPPGCGYLSFLQDLRMSFAKNPQLKIFAAAGRYDLVCPYFGQEYSLNHLFLPENLQGNISFTLYEAGHMIYTEEKARTDLSRDLHSFVSTFFSQGAGSGK